MSEPTMDMAHAPQLAEAGDILGHPMGRRKTDPHLAQAVLHSLGRWRSTQLDAAGTLSEGLAELRPGLLRRALDAVLWRTTTPVTSRRWPLWRSRQIDQGATPWCVDATRIHWERSVPTITLKGGLPFGKAYELAKQDDGFPGEDGTTAAAMLRVMQAEGQVASHWWYTGDLDADAAIRWLLEHGPMWWGVSLPESAFRTDKDHVMRLEGEFRYGHEMCLIGRTRNYKRMGPAIEGVQSWGNANYGLAGRFWILEKDFFEKAMHPEFGWGDLVGVVEARSA